MSSKIPFWIARAARQCSNAARLGRIAGEGDYALMSCRDGESRHVRLYMSAGERNRAIAAWDRIGHCGLGDKCRFDHPTIRIENGTTPTTTEQAAELHSR
jgi:hypothetical protein